MWCVHLKSLINFAQPHTATYIYWSYLRAEEYSFLSIRLNVIFFFLLSLSFAHHLLMVFTLCFAIVFCFHRLKRIFIFICTVFFFFFVSSFGCLMLSLPSRFIHSLIHSLRVVYFAYKQNSSSAEVEAMGKHCH